MKITNISTGPRGVNTVKGLVFIPAGQTMDLDLPEAEAKDLSPEWFETGAKAAREAKAEQPPGFEAKHRGGGSYSVLDANGNEVVESLSKEDAEAFNAMKPAEQAEYVEASKK